MSLPALTDLKGPLAVSGPVTRLSAGLPLFPQQLIESSSASIAQVWNSPALTDLKEPPAPLGPVTRLSAGAAPQQLIEYSASIAQVWVPPALTPPSRPRHDRQLGARRRKVRA